MFFFCQCHLCLFLFFTTSLGLSGTVLLLYLTFLVVLHFSLRKKKLVYKLSPLRSVNVLHHCNVIVFLDQFFSDTSTVLAFCFILGQSLFLTLTVFIFSRSALAYTFTIVLLFFFLRLSFILTECFNFSN